MPNFYLNSAGTNVSPWDTSATGAHNFASIQSSGLVNDGDFIFVCSNISSTSASVWDKNVTITSIDSTKYETVCSQIFTPSVVGTIGIDGITISDGGVFGNGAIFGPPTGTNESFQINNCIISNSNPSVGPPIAGYDITIENNLFISNSPYPIAPGWLSISETYNTGGTVRINNNVFQHNYTSIYIPPVDIGFIGIDNPGAESNIASVQIYNNIFYNISNDPYIYAFLPNLQSSASAPLTNLVFENNNIYNGAGFFGGTYASDAGTPTKTNTTINPQFTDPTNGDYTIQAWTPLFNSGYNGYQIGLGLIALLTEIAIGSVTTDVQSIDFDGNCEPLPGYISILEKIHRLIENFDPWLMPEENIQYYAHNLGYPLDLSRDDIGIEDYTGADAEVLAVDKKKYYRFMAATLPDWYQIKTSRAAIRVLLYSFGLLGDCVYYYTKDYLDPLLQTTSDKDNAYATFLEQTSVNEGSNVRDLYKQMCALESQLATLKIDFTKIENWLLTNWDPSKIEEDISNIPDEYFPTPHFRIWFDIKTSSEAGNYSKRLKLQNSVAKAIATVKPINTVFSGITGYFAPGVTTAYAMSYVRTRKEMKLYNEKPADYWNI